MLDKDMTRTEAATEPCECFGRSERPEEENQSDPDVVRLRRAASIDEEALARFARRLREDPDFRDFISA